MIRQSMTHRRAFQLAEQINSETGYSAWLIEIGRNHAAVAIRASETTVVFDQPRDFEVWSDQREAIQRAAGARLVVLSNEAAALLAEWWAVSNEDNCPNLRDFYPRYGEFMEAVAAWHAAKDDVLARRNANLAARIAARRFLACPGDGEG